MPVSPDCKRDWHTIERILREVGPFHAVVTFEDKYPHHEGTITGIEQCNTGGSKNGEMCLVIKRPGTGEYHLHDSEIDAIYPNPVLWGRKCL